MNNIRASSIRGFGIVFFFVFTIIALYPLLNNHGIRVWSLIFGFIFLFLGLANSSLLKPLNLIWFKFGLFFRKDNCTYNNGYCLFFSCFSNISFSKVVQKKLLEYKI